MYMYVYVCIKVDVCCTAGETDWKILAIDVTDPLADKLNGEIQLSLWLGVHQHTPIISLWHRHTRW